MSDSNAAAPPLVLIADGAHRDPGSGKWTLLGIFSSINSTQFPYIHPHMAAYLAFTPAAGKTAIRFQMIASDAPDKPLFRVDAELNVQIAGAAADLAIPIRNVTFPKAGEYRLQVFANEQFLVERRFVATLVQGQAKA